MRKNANSVGKRKRAFRAAIELENVFSEDKRERERASLGCFLDTYSVRSFTRGSGRVGDDPNIETTMLMCHYCCLQKTRKNLGLQFCKL
jgi:hypothetical protein